MANTIKYKDPAEFIVFSWSFFIGLTLIVFWNINHYYDWFEDLGRVWGTGLATILFGSAYFINAIVEGRRRIITNFFLYLTISNLFDELFFDPLEINVWEFLIALFIWISIYFKNNVRITGRNS